MNERSEPTLNPYSFVHRDMSLSLSAVLRSGRLSYQLNPSQDYADGASFTQGVNEALQCLVRVLDFVFFSTTEVYIQYNFSHPLC